MARNEKINQIIIMLDEIKAILEQVAEGNKMPYSMFPPPENKLPYGREFNPSWEGKPMQPGYCPKCGNASIPQGSKCKCGYVPPMYKEDVPIPKLSESPEAPSGMKGIAPLYKGTISAGPNYDNDINNYTIVITEEEQEQLRKEGRLSYTRPPMFTGPYDSPKRHSPDSASVDDHPSFYQEYPLSTDEGICAGCKRKRPARDIRLGIMCPCGYTPTSPPPNPKYGSPDWVDPIYAMRFQQAKEKFWCLHKWATRDLGDLQPCIEEVRKVTVPMLDAARRKYMRIRAVNKNDLPED
jgi:hypothetical protein